MSLTSYLTLADMESWIRLLAQTFEREMERLSQLDAALGDGDHGASMVRGWWAVVARLDAGFQAADIGSLLHTVGMALLSATGGATGPLFGTIFMEAGKQARGKTEIDLQDVAAMVQAAASAVMARGGAKPGEKTMVDALVPAAEALQAAVAAGASLSAALAQAASAARDGAQSTAHMLASKGRSRYLGERSLGHEDPGAHSVALILASLADVAHQSASAGAHTCLPSGGLEN